MDKIYGYVRVSSNYQNEDRQMIALKGKGINWGIYCRPCVTNTFFCRRKRTVKYKKATGRGHCRRKTSGSAVWQTRNTYTR